MDIGELQQVFSGLEVVRSDDLRSFSPTNTERAQVLDAESGEWLELQLKNGGERYLFFVTKDVPNLREKLIAALRGCLVHELTDGFFVTLLIDTKCEKFALIRGVRSGDPNEMTMIDLF